MFSIPLAFLSLSLFAPVFSSFYDNPEQDPSPPTDTDSAEELHRKWDFEVLLCYCILLLYFRFPMTLGLIRISGDFQEYRLLRISNM